MPVQRIPRYSLLIRDLIRFTSPDHVDYKDLCTALEKIDSVNVYLNTRKSEAEHRQVLVEIASTLDIPHEFQHIDVIKPNRSHLRDGDVIISLGKHTSRPGKLFLFNDGMLFSKVQRMKSNQKVINFTPFDNSLQNITQSGLIIKVQTTSIQFEIEFASQDLADSWLKQIQAAAQAATKKGITNSTNQFV